MHTRQFFTIIITLCCLWLNSAAVLAKQKYQTLKIDQQHVDSWNNFVDELYQLHLQQTRKQPTVTQQQDGGYGGRTGVKDFYTQVDYYSKESQRLLSRIQWEKQFPDRIHSIEVFIYGDDNRLAYDFYARYLPEFRNAPIQTLINVHNYNDRLHAFRQFDASGNLIYETCRGEYFNESVQLHLEEDDIPRIRNSINEETIELYRSCFSGVRQEAGELLQPYQHFSQVSDRDPQANNMDSLALERSLSHYNQAIWQQPHQAELYIKRGNVYFNLHQFANAVKDYTRAIELDNSLDQAYYGRGMSLARDGQIAQGIADLSVFIQRNPQDSNAYTKRGVRYIWAKQLDLAKQDLQRAIELNPRNAEAHDDLGVVLAQEKDFQQASHHFAEAIRHDPDYQKAYHNLGMVHLILNQPERALLQVNRALQLNPQSRNSLMLKSEVLLKLGRKTEADKVLQKAEFLPEGNWSEFFAIQQ